MWNEGTEQEQVSERDQTLHKLAIFAVSEGLTKKTFSRDEVLQKINLFKRKIDKGSFDETWLADNLLAAYRDKMEKTCIDGFKNTVTSSIEESINQHKSIFYACVNIWKIPSKNIFLRLARKFRCVVIASWSIAAIVGLKLFNTTAKRFRLW